MGTCQLLHGTSVKYCIGHDAVVTVTVIFNHFYCRVYGGSVINWDSVVKWPLSHHWMNFERIFSIEKSPWEANSLWASQEIPRLLWNPKFRYRVHKRAPLEPYPEPDKSSPLSHTLYKINFNVIITSTPRSSKCSPTVRFSDSYYVCISRLSRALNVLRPSHPP